MKILRVITLRFCAVVLALIVESRSDLLSTNAKPRLAHGFATDKTLVLFLGGLGTEEPETRINSIEF